MILGISQEGKWILNNKNYFCILSDKRDYLYCSSMLEVPYEEIKIQIEKKFNSIMENEKIDLISIFPIIQLIEFTFVHLKNDYWFELAMGWYENLDLSIQYKLISLFKIISETGKFSQKNRQRARKEVKKLERLKNVMDEKDYELLCELVEHFENSKLNGEEIFCFVLMKKMIDEKILVECIEENTRITAKKQMEKVEEYFQCFNLSLPKEFKEYFN